jgi:hypothetical protein
VESSPASLLTKVFAHGNLEERIKEEAVLNKNILRNPAKINLVGK